MFTTPQIPEVQMPFHNERVRSHCFACRQSAIG